MFCGFKHIQGFLDFYLKIYSEHKDCLKDENNDYHYSANKDINDSENNDINNTKTMFTLGGGIINKSENDGNRIYSIKVFSVLFLSIIL